MIWGIIVLALLFGTVIGGLAYLCKLGMGTWRAAIIGMVICLAATAVIGGVVFAGIYLIKGSL